VLRLSADYEVRALDLPEVDIAAPSSLAAAVTGYGPDYIVNAAAYTDVEGAETHRDDAYRINATAAGLVAEEAARAGIPILHYSTDFVFDGTKRTPYEADDPIAPVSVYGTSKADGEAAVRAATPRHFIVRTAWLYGPGGNNFVEKILRAAVSRPALTVVDDEIGSPTHTWDLAGATAALLATKAYGTYHAVNAGACSRFEFAREIVRLGGLSTPVEACDSSRFPTQARRPAYSVLSNHKLEAATGCVMRPWKDALRHYVERRNSA